MLLRTNQNIERKGKTMTTEYITKVVKDNKTIDCIKWAYDTSNATTIYDIYNKPSRAKYIAELTIKQEMAEVGGYGYKVLGCTTSQFMCGYRLGADLIYFTRLYKYIIKGAFEG